MDGVTSRSARRMGPAGSDNWHAMLDGAEAILRDEGHAALTSRAVAERVGVKQRLVYYYFRTMDELVVELFRRSTERELKRIEDARASDRPLREVWDICIHTADTRLISEYMALANHNDDLKVEVVRFIEESRRMQIDAIVAAMGRSAGTSAVAPPGLALIATSVALAMTRERQLGVELGHAEAMDAIKALIAGLEPES